MKDMLDPRLEKDQSQEASLLLLSKVSKGLRALHTHLLSSCSLSPSLSFSFSRSLSFSSFSYPQGRILINALVAMTTCVLYFLSILSFNRDIPQE